MNRYQKMALFTVIVISIAILATITAIAILLMLGFGWPKAFAGSCFMGIAGFAGLTPVIYKKGKSKISFDERDLLIGKKAALAGFGSAFGFTGISSIAGITAALLLKKYPPKILTDERDIYKSLRGAEWIGKFFFMVYCYGYNFLLFF